jgi:hypothetical protein
MEKKESLVISIVSGTEGSARRLGIIGLRMRNFVFKRIYTLHSGKRETYEVVGTTFSSLKDIIVNKEALSEFYRRNYHIALVHRDIPVFVCKGGYLVPPEVAYEEKWRLDPNRMDILREIEIFSELELEPMYQDREGQIDCKLEEIIERILSAFEQEKFLETLLLQRV